MVTFEDFRSFGYYAIAVVYMVCAIPYFLQTLGIIGQLRVRGDVAGSMNQTWGQTTTLLSNAADIARKLNNAIEGPAKEEAKKTE